MGGGGGHQPPASAPAFRTSSTPRTSPLREVQPAAALGTWPNSGTRWTTFGRPVYT